LWSGSLSANYASRFRFRRDAEIDDDLKRAVEEAPTRPISRLTRRSALFAVVASLLQTSTLFAGEKQVITVHKDPTCGCCSGWVEHLQKAGFGTKVLDTKDIDAVKKRLGVPDDLAACHTAEVSGYVIEGHVPAAALKQLPGREAGRERPCCAWHADRLARHGGRQTRTV
jgi:hypothetical protein